MNSAERPGVVPLPDAVPLIWKSSVDISDVLYNFNWISPEVLVCWITPSEEVLYIFNFPLENDIGISVSRLIVVPPPIFPATPLKYDPSP